MADAARPRLASDVARSWVAIAGWCVMIVGIPLLLLLLPVFRDEPLPHLVTGSFSISWTVFCALVVLLTLGTFGKASGTELRAWLDATAAPTSPLRRLWWSLNGGGAIWWALSGTAVALTILFDLSLSGRETHPLFIAAGIAVVPASIAVIVVSFAVSHARMDVGRALEFPKTPHPSFADYVYLSVQLSTTFGSSDVAVTSTRMRRAVAFHSLLAFTFNAIIIALLVSVLLNTMR